MQFICLRVGWVHLPQLILPRVTVGITPLGGIYLALAQETKIVFGASVY